MPLLSSRSFWRLADRPEVTAKRPPRHRGLFKLHSFPGPKHTGRLLLALLLPGLFSAGVPAQDRPADIVQRAHAAHRGTLVWSAGLMI